MSGHQSRRTAGGKDAVGMSPGTDLADGRLGGLSRAEAKR